MPIVTGDFGFWLAASRPEDDTNTGGGAIVTTARPLQAQFSAAARPEIDSDNAADTMNVQIHGRNAAGELINETKALNGTTAVLFDATFERIHKVTIASASAGTVTVAQGTGGTIRHTFAPAQLVAAILYINAVSHPTDPKVRYDKIFGRNTHGTLSLTSAEVEMITDTSDLYEMALAASKGDSVTVANRLTAPAGGLTFVGEDTAVAVPTGNLAAGENIGVWVKQSLAAANAAGKDAPVFQLDGNTTE